MESKACRTHLEPKCWGFRISAFSAAHSLNWPQTHLCTKVHSETSLPSHHWTLPGLGSSHSIPVVPKSLCITAVIQSVCVGGACFVAQCQKKGSCFDVMTVSVQSVITSLSSGLSRLDASVYHTVRPLAALLVSQPPRPRLPTQSSCFSDCKEFLCSGSAAEKSFLCHYQWLHPPAAMHLIIKHSTGNFTGAEHRCSFSHDRLEVCVWTSPLTCLCALDVWRLSLLSFKLSQTCTLRRTRCSLCSSAAAVQVCFILCFVFVLSPVQSLCFMLAAPKTSTFLFCLFFSINISGCVLFFYLF